MADVGYPLVVPTTVAHREQSLGKDCFHASLSEGYMRGYSGRALSAKPIAPTIITIILLAIIIWRIST